MLALGLFIDRIGVLRRTLPRVLPHVDDAFVLIDSRAHHEVAEFIRSLGLRWSYHRWSDHYSESINHLLDECVDWVMNLDCDEDIDHPELLRSLVPTDPSVVVGFPRRSWWDIHHYRDMPEWFPDRQWRLMHRSQRLRYRVHPDFAGTVVRHDVATPIIEHYHRAMHTDADTAAKQDLYLRMLRADEAEGRDLTLFGYAPKGYL